MINFILYFFTLSFLLSSNNLDNSIYSFSKNAKTNALSNVHYISEDVDGLFYQPISKNINMLSDSYFSYSEIHSNQFKIFQIGYCLKSNEKNNISIGMVRRDIDNLFDTSSAWDNNQLLIPELNDIDYTNISNLSYQDFGFLISHNKYIKNKILNLKFKPYYNKIKSNDAYGFDIDFTYVISFIKFDFMFGIENLFSHKKWNSGIKEKKLSNYFLTSSYVLDKTTFFYEFSTLNSNKLALQHNVNNFFNIRFGLDSENKKTFGFGVSSKLFDIDYAIFNSQFQLGSSSQISIVFKNN